MGLTKLLLNDNALTGSIPSSLARLAKLKELELQHNQLTGLVPELPFAKCELRLLPAGYYAFGLIWLRNMYFDWKSPINQNFQSQLSPNAS